MYSPWSSCRTCCPLPMLIVVDVVAPFFLLVSLNCFRGKDRNQFQPNNCCCCCGGSGRRRLLLFSSSFLPLSLVSTAIKTFRCVHRCTLQLSFAECLVALSPVCPMCNPACKWRTPILQRYFQVSPKLLGFGEACFGVLKVSCCGVASWTLRNLATSVSMIWICFQVMQLELHACTRKSMQADLHAARSPYVLIICSSPVVFVCNALFLFLLLHFHTYKPQTNLVNVCAQLISLRNEHFFGDTLCCVFMCTNSRHTLKTCLCCAFYWRKPCHDHKPQSNLNSRQRRKSTVAARKKEIN